MNQLQNISVRFALMLGGLSLPSLKREEGQTLVEYALILVSIAILVLVSLTFLKDRITSVFTQVGNAV
jgi:Flp pilus assembly pilin Flp